MKTRVQGARKKTLDVMFTLHNKFLKRAGGLLMPLCLAAAFCAGTAMNVHAQSAPPNDDLANAQAISGLTGSILGTNLDATMETHEPAPYGAGASIWYVWTAPITTTIDFSTLGSIDLIQTDTNYGGDLDTVLAVYTLTSGANLAFTNMTLVASNEYDPSGGGVYDPSSGLSSRVDFPVTVGTVYFIQVLGSTNNPTGLFSYAEGTIALNWSQSLVAGTFGFTATNIYGISPFAYFAGALDDVIPVGEVTHSTDPSLANEAGDANVRITVARQGGGTGKCEVTLTVTNLTYTNIFITNYVITNIYATNYTDGTLATVSGYTNTFFTNIASENLISDPENFEGVPLFVQLQIENDITVTQTNANGSLSLLVTNVVGGFNPTNFLTNFPCAAGTTGVTNTNSPYSIIITQVLCSNIISTNFTPSASNGVDYTAFTTTLTFDDFQMSKDVYVQVNPQNMVFNAYGGIGPVGPDWPDAAGNYTAYGVNPLVLLSLSNPMLDPSEDLNITPPTLSTSQSNAYLDILSLDGNPNDYIGSAVGLTTNTSPQDYVVVNLERATFRVNRGVGTAYLYAVLSGNPASGNSYTFHYTIDCEDFAGAVGLPISAFDWNRFLTVANSDYAVPSYYTNEGVTFPDFGLPINTPYDPSGDNVGVNTTWPADRPWVGSFTFGPFPAPIIAEIAIPILTNGAVEFDMDMDVELFETTGDATGNAGETVPGFLGNITSANLTINFTGQPGGANDLSYNIDNSPSSSPANNPVPGANGGPVRAVAMQTNGQAVIGGYFSSYDTTPVYGIARLLSNGFLDTNFNYLPPPNEPGVGNGGYVLAIAIDASGRIIIGGSFSAYNNLPNITVNNIARLNYNGSLDTNFNSGTGFNGSVTALAVDANGNILVGGNFTSYNTTNCNHIARLLPGGGLDPAFLPNTGNGLSNYGTDKPVLAVATDTSGNIILGGKFTYVNGSNMNYVARLLPGGALDPSFNPQIGPDDYVESVAIETNNNNEIVIGGAFQNYQLVSRPGVALIANNGSLDTSFVPGSGADGMVYTVTIQPANGDILVGGQFRNFNSSRRLGVARLLPNGWVDTSFMDTAYNQFAGLINKAYSDPVNIAYALALQPDGNIIVGGSFTNVGGGSTRADIHNHINVDRLIGTPTLGPQTSGGGIGNCPGNITLTQNPYTVDDTAGKFFVTLDRVNGSLGPSQLTLGTNLLAPGPGSATAADLGLILSSDVSLYDTPYAIGWTIVPNGTYAWRESDGYYGFNNAIQPPFSDFGASALNLSIYDDTATLNNLFANISELNVSSQGLLVLGGVPIPLYPALGLPSASLEIVNDNVQPGVVGFSASNYTAIDTSSSVTITVVRTNGTSDPITVQYFTKNGSAISGGNYTGVTVQQDLQVSFPGGVGAANNTQTFTIPITVESAVEPNTEFKVYLTNSNPGGVINTNPGVPVYSSATVTIIDGNYAPGHLSFTSPTFSVLKPGLATVSVQRLGGATGQLTVQCGASDGTGTNGINYTGVTNTLTWSNQDVSVKTMTIQTLQDNVVEGPKTVNLSLFNATNVGSTGNSNNLILNSPSNAVLTILDSDNFGGLSFVTPNFNIMQNAGQALITVIRTNGTTGTISVNYTNFGDAGATNFGANYQPAVAGVNYKTVSGTLIFSNGQPSQSFVVPIYYTPNESSPANRMVTLKLVSGSPAGISNQNTFPISATVTILDPKLVNYPAGSVDQTTLNGTGFNNVVDSLVLQPDGSVLAGGAFTFFNRYPFNYVARLNPSGAFDSSFLFDQAGANASVLQVLSQTPGNGQTNGPVVIVGDFTQVDSINRGGIARLNLNGSMDETFNPGSGADKPILSIAEAFLPAAVSNQFTLAYYIGGNFANYNGIPSGGIARLNASTNSPGYQGNVDPNFNVGQGVTSGDAGIYALAVQANGQVILGGDFTAFNSVAYNHLVRLNVDGSVDTSFNPNTNYGPADSVRAIAIQPDGQIIIGGLFTNVGGNNLNYLARLNSTDGSVDTNFNVGVGGDDVVLALAVDSQNRILVGGEFSRFSGVTRNGITRLNPDGTVDPTINFGSAADGGYVDTIAIQNNDEIDLGGGFSTFEGITENNFVRLYGGAIYGEGSFVFNQAGYGVLQNGTNAVITIQRLGGEGTTNEPTVSVVFSTSNGSPLAGFEPGQAGIDYVGVTNIVTFPFGETFETVTIPILNNYSVGSNKNVNLNLSNPSTNAYLGSIASATLYITNVNSAVSFSAPTYAQNANVAGGNEIITVVRIGDPNSTVGITVYTGTNGTATPNVNYTPTTNFIVFNPGVMTNYFLVPLLNASNMFSPQTVDLEMSNPSNTFIGSPSSAILTIDNVYGGPGFLAFSQPSYSIVAPIAGVTNEIITIIRTNGSSNSVSVTFTTSNGTAVAGIDYASIQTNLNFHNGVTNQTVSIPVDPQPNAGPATTVLLTLSNPQNGAIIGGAAQEILTILNGIESFTFTNSPYTVGESNGSVTLQIVRNGPMANAASVNYNTFSPPNTTEAEGYAQSNVDYMPASGTLSFAPNETFTTIPITIIQGNAVNGPLTFQVLLSDPLPLGVQVGPTSVASVLINSDVTGFEFSANSYVVGENGSNIVITVNRLNPGTGVASVQYATSDGTNLNSASNALNQVDYDSTNGTLTFQNNQATASFTVPILNRNIVESSKTFNVTLSNPAVLTLPNPSTNAYLLSPSNATVMITNVLAGVSFESPTYTVSECGVTAAIPVVLIGATNNPVSVNYNTTTNGGSATVGVNYLATNGTLTLSNGQTVQTIYVQVFNNHIIGPNHTVFLALSNPTNAVLLNPSTAVLTIQECNGAYIVNSGTAFVSGSVSNNFGVIFPNETVTILFGLRDIAGSNTTNLVATLLATNGVTNVSVPQTYGVLITNGPTVSRSFTFKAVGTNGQNISANLALQDGSQVYSNVDFGFALGGLATTFGTNETLLLKGSTPGSIPVYTKAYNSNPPNYGYPSVINVSLVGIVTAVTATVSNIGHSYMSDVAVVLEGPESLGQGTVLMDDCGGSNSVQNVNLTFSQSASSPLPKSSAFASGTYLPTDYGMVELPATMSGQESAPTNFLTNLSAFVGQSPNGIWSLFVADEDSLDFGYISNGWSLSISTGIPVEENSDLEMAMTATPAAATLGNTLTYSISVTNYGPAAATNVWITNTLPSGVSYMGSSCNCTVETNGLTNGVLTFTVATLAVSNGVTFNVGVIPDVLGYITNIAAATANEPDLNVNNVQTNVVLVSAPSADVGVTISGGPNPVLDGANVIYTIVVTNNGPSTATGVTAINMLPAGFILMTNQTLLTQGAITNANGTITWNAGAMTNGSSATLTIVAGVFLPENGLPSAKLDSVTVSSQVYDPAKLNNYAAVKTEVEPAMINVAGSGSKYSLSWQAVAGNIVLEGAVTVSGPWMPIANPAAVGGIYTYVLPGTNGYHFFRLISKLP
jgi:uncharacterized repeat protein (TIGR01451 family)/uncharacterized delta-60 repeat protein